MSKRASEAVVPSGPFAAWLTDRYNELIADEEPAPAARLAMEIGFVEGEGDKAVDNGVRRMYRYRRAISETKRGGEYQILPATEYLRPVVENACDHVRADLFGELYPEHVRDTLLVPELDIDLEPDAWCPFCREWVTPIDGLCPFCECEHGHLFREVGVTDDGFACLACSRREAQERRHRAKEAA